MTSKTDDLIAADPYSVDRHLADMAAGYSGERAGPAQNMARGAADSMWQSVEADLDKIDQAEIEDVEDE